MILSNFSVKNAVDYGFDQLLFKIMGMSNLVDSLVWNDLTTDWIQAEQFRVLLNSGSISVCKFEVRTLRC